MKEVTSLLIIALFAVILGAKVAAADPCQSYSSADTDSYWCAALNYGDVAFAQSYSDVLPLCL